MTPERPLPLTHWQSTLQRHLPQVRALYAEHGLNLQPIEALAPLVAQFDIRVPFIGAFSCGKSSLLNALLGEALLATDVTPETAVPAELRYGTPARFVGLKPKGSEHCECSEWPLNADDLRQNRLEPLRPDGWVQAHLPSPALAARPQLVLVDMPGWDSGLSAHEQVIDTYAARSLAYAVVVSADDGTLRDTLRKALLELAVHNKPVLLVITKADKREPSDLSAVVERVHGEISDLMRREPLALAVTSARKRDLGSLHAALDTLQSQAEAIFQAAVLAPWARELEHAAQRLRLLTNQEHHDGARLQAEIDQLEQDMRAFDQRQQQETSALRERVGSILGAIRQRVENALGARVETLTSRALNGQNISDDVLGTARVVIAEALRQEFEPELQRYLERLVDALPSRLDFHFESASVKLEGAGADGGATEFRWKALATTLAPLLLKIPHPLAKLLAPLALLLGHLLDSRATQQRQQVQQERQREQVRSQVLGALDDAVREIEAQLRPALEQQIDKAQAEALRAIAAERAETERSLQQLSQALQQGQAQVAALRAQAQASLERLLALRAELPAALATAAATPTKAPTAP